MKWRVGWSLLGLISLIILIMAQPVWGEEPPVNKGDITRGQVTLQEKMVEKDQSLAGPWQIKSGDEVISEKQVIEGDLLFFGEHLEIDGNIRGDLIVYTGDLVINGRVDGSVIGVVLGNMTLNGSIGGNLRLLASGIDLNGNVNRSVTVGATQFQTSAASKVEGGLLGYFLAKGSLTGQIDGPVNIGSMSVIELGGRIRGDVKAAGLRINWLPPVEIAGTVADHSQVPENPAKVGQIKVGKYRYYEPSAGDQLEAFKSLMMFSFILFISGLLLSLIFYRLFPRTAWTISEPSPANFKANLLAGLLGFFGIPLLCLILFLTMMGIALAVFLALIYIVLVFFAWAPVYLWFGRLIFKSRLKPSVMIVFGGLILLLIGFIPFFSFILQILLTILGMGMVIRNIKPQYKELINVK
ncbi:MAG: polymer-forming cytoskeletal protein [Firmicutes bacterium]|nr:polymer-forming cytoskeletal protein [Bacillota bacterium]